jgi:hypothetical protein
MSVELVNSKVHSKEIKLLLPSPYFYFIIIEIYSQRFIAF